MLLDPMSSIYICDIIIIRDSASEYYTTYVHR